MSNGAQGRGAIRPTEGQIFRRPTDGRALRVAEIFSDGACGCELVAPPFFSEWIEIAATDLAGYEPVLDEAEVMRSEEGESK